MKQGRCGRRLVLREGWGCAAKPLSRFEHGEDASRVGLSQIVVGRQRVHLHGCACSADAEQGSQARQQEYPPHGLAISHGKNSLINHNIMLNRILGMERICLGMTDQWRILPGYIPVEAEFRGRMPFLISHHYDYTLHFPLSF